jgi:hypothetical protein
MRTMYRAASSDWVRRFRVIHIHLNQGGLSETDEWNGITLRWLVASQSRTRHWDFARHGATGLHSHFMRAWTVLHADRRRKDGHVFRWAI